MHAGQDRVYAECARLHPEIALRSASWNFDFGSLTFEGLNQNMGVAQN